MATKTQEHFYVVVKTLEKGVEIREYEAQPNSEPPSDGPGKSIL